MARWLGIQCEYSLSLYTCVSQSLYAPPPCVLVTYSYRPVTMTLSAEQTVVVSASRHFVDWTCRLPLTAAMKYDDVTHRKNTCMRYAFAQPVLECIATAGTQLVCYAFLCSPANVGLVGCLRDALYPLEKLLQSRHSCLMLPLQGMSTYPILVVKNYSVCRHRRRLDEGDRLHGVGRQTLFRQTLFRQTLFRQSAVRTTQYISSTLGTCRNSRNWEETGTSRGVVCIESTALIEALR